jgi:hypothetical protein
MSAHELTDEELAEKMDLMYHEARKAIQSDPKRATATAIAYAHAMREAQRTPGCEVRVTCRNLEEMLFARIVIEEGLALRGWNDEARSTLDQIELTNGSCIRVLTEKTDETKSESANG